MTNNIYEYIAFMLVSAFLAGLHQWYRNRKRNYIIITKNDVDRLCQKIKDANGLSSRSVEIIREFLKIK